MSTNAEIIQQLRWIRENAHTTNGTEKLTTAELAGRVGKSQSLISQLETSTRRVNLDMLHDWAEACGYQVRLSFIPASAALPPRVERVVSLLCAVGGDVPPLLLEELEWRLRGWSEEGPRWRARFDAQGRSLEE